MSLIRAIHLEQWGNTSEGSKNLGLLIRKLINASIKEPGHITKMRFYDNESDCLSGWDGLLEYYISDIPEIPNGRSVWEISTEKNPRNKIRRDLENRQNQELPANWLWADTTYIAVTTREIDNIVDFENELKSDYSRWENIIVLDGVALQRWIEQYPGVETWFKEMHLALSSTIRTLDYCCKKWLNSTTPNILPNLLVADRTDISQGLFNFLNRTTDATKLNLKAESPDEVIAFVYSVISLSSDDKIKEHLLSKSIIIDNDNDANSQDISDHIILLKPPATEHANNLLEKNNLIINIIDNSSVSYNVDYELNRISQSSFKDVLIDMGVASEDAFIESRVCGSNPAIWRIWKLINNNDLGSSIPEWCKQSNATDIIPAILLGGWSNNNNGDIDALKKLSGESDYNIYRSKLQKYNVYDNRPLINLGDSWHIAAPSVTFMLIKNHINTTHLDNLSDVAMNVFQEIDPKVEMKPDKRFYANIENKILTHSVWLRDGLAETLLRIVVLGNNLESNGVIPGSATCQDFVNNIISSLPGLKNDWRLIASLDKQLPVLMEATPVPFLEAFEKILKGPPECIMPIFEEGNSGLVSSLHINMLWGLECLAWDKDLLPRVSLILAKLSQLDPGGRTTNRPINSLKEIFLAWHPCTSATPQERVAVLGVIISKFPDIGWKLLLRLLPGTHGFTKTTYEPRYRDFDKSQIYKPQETMQRSFELYIELAIQHAEMNINKWYELFDCYDSLSEKYQKQFESSLMLLAKESTNEDELYKLWSKLRDFLNKHKKYADTAWALSKQVISRLDSIVKLFEPNDFVRKYSWLFNKFDPDMPVPTIISDEKKKHLAQLRADVVKELWCKDGMKSFLHFVNQIKFPALTVEPLIALVKSKEQIENIFNNTISGSDNEIIFAKRLSLEAFKLFDKEWTGFLIQNKDKMSVDSLVNVFTLYPDSLETYKTIESIGIEYDKKYWETQTHDFHAMDEKTAQYAINKLLEANDILSLISLPKKIIDKIETDKLTNIMDKLIDKLNEPECIIDINEIGHDVRSHIELLRDRDDIDSNKIASYEYIFLQLYSLYSNNYSLTLHDELSKSPSFFMELICSCYKPETSEVHEEITSEQDKIRAKNAWEILHSWKIPPGVDKNGIPDEEALKKWVSNVFKIAKNKNRLSVTEQHVGIIMYHYPKDPTDNIWPHKVLRNLLEELQNDEVEKGIELEQFNSRGTVCKSLYEGGKQERELAKKWLDMAAQIDLIYIRTKALLKRISDSWKREAVREDAKAEKDKLRFN